MKETVMPAITPKPGAYPPAIPGLPTPVVQIFHREPVMVLDSRGHPWLMVHAEQDPLRTRGGKLPIPRQCRDWLKEIADSGVAFHAIVLAHELDPHQVTAEMPRIGKPCAQEQARQLLGEVPDHPDLARVKRIYDRITGSPSAIASRLSLDPVVFGVIGKNGPPAEGEPALFFPLVAWSW